MLLTLAQVLSESYVRTGRVWKAADMWCVGLEDRSWHGARCNGLVCRPRRPSSHHDLLCGVVCLSVCPLLQVRWRDHLPVGVRLPSVQRRQPRAHLQEDQAGQVSLPQVERSRRRLAQRLGQESHHRAAANAAEGPPDGRGRAQASVDQRRCRAGRAPALGGRRRARSIPKQDETQESRRQSAGASHDGG